MTCPNSPGPTSGQRRPPPGQDVAVDVTDLDLETRLLAGLPIVNAFSRHDTASKPPANVPEPPCGASTATAVKVTGVPSPPPPTYHVRCSTVTRTCAPR